MISTVQLNELERFNVASVAGIPRELRTLEMSLAGASPQVARDALLEVAPAIADRHGRVMAAGSAEWYEQARRSQVGGTYAARTAPLPDPDVVRRNVLYAAGALFVADRVSPFQSLAGSLERHVMDVGRDTIKTNVDQDRRAAGWHRIARADGCDFCVMLASRGSVYKKQTADFASHDNCRCQCAPSWDPSAPEMPARAYEASQRTGAMSPAQKTRHQRNLNDWMSSNSHRLDDLRAELL